MKKPTVLLVEDSEDDAFIFNWRFERSKVTCVVRHVLEGAAAIEYLKNVSASDPDSLPVVIFLDLKMPVMNGFEVLSWLREQEFFSRIPVIVLSGSDQQTDKDRASQLGAAAYWVKPVSVVDIQKYFKNICPDADQGAELQPSKTQT